ncbi:MAG: malonyl-[acyl-carrier protein] O-methyltransferase BioC, partial [Deltaproteobacteria bacterium]
GYTSACYTVLDTDQSCETLWFEHPLAVLQHLRQTGVNAIGSKSWTRRQLHQFCSEYEKLYAGAKGVQLTYHPMYFIGRPTQAL